MSIVSTDSLSDSAWAARENARVIGPTRVGVAVVGGDGEIITGCNMEHRYRSHDIHGEVSAIAAFVASGRRDLRTVFVAAEREHFTPCGACLDWIFEIGGPDTEVLVQSARGAEVTRYSAAELMPHYPR